MNPTHSPTLTDEELQQLIREDVPYFDLTTLALDIGDIPAQMSFATRHETVICGTEEVARLFALHGATVMTTVSSGTTLPAGTMFLQAKAPAATLHTVWKVAINLLEYLSGIATSTRTMVEAARRANPGVQIVTTRKMFPGTKPLAIKAVLAGGGMPHRLGLSETLLVFPQHLALLGGLDGFIERLDDLRHHSPEKKIAVEVETLDQATQVVQAGVDILQIDKMPVAMLQETVTTVRALDQRVVLAIAGGVNLSNVAEYAATGVDLIVTSALYTAKPADIAARIERG